MALLEINDIHTYYGAIHALRGVTIHVDEGEIVTLIGSNGAGKSTTLRSISGLLRPRKGEIILRGKRIDGLRPHEIVELGVSQSPEGRRVFARMTVHENLEMGAFSRKDKVPVADFDHIYDLFPRLRERTAQRAGTLSGGEQQMLAVARALMLRPRLMLLDEPSFGLAHLIVRDLFKILGKINREDKVTILVVEQNAQLALELADRAYVIETGRIVMSGSADEIANNEDVRKSYLGY